MRLDHHKIGDVRHMEGFGELIRQLENQRLMIVREQLALPSANKESVRAVLELLDELLAELQRIRETPDAG